MKLLFCPICWDVFKLTTAELRSCSCGLCKGQYYADGSKAMVNGKGLSFAIANQDFEDAIKLTKKNKSVAMRCWARPHEGESNPRTEVIRSLK